MWFPFFLFSGDFIPLYSGYFTTQLVLIVSSFLFFFGVFFLLRFIKRSDSATQKLNWEWQRKWWGRGKGEKAGRKTTRSQPLEIFEMPHPVLWKEKFGLRMIWHVLKSDVSQQTVVPKICCLWLFIKFSFLFIKALCSLFKE